MLSIEEENWEPLRNKHKKQSISHLVIKIIPPNIKKLGIGNAGENVQSRELTLDS